MKKTLLLLTVLCFGMLAAMENPTLLPELKKEIVKTALASSKNIDEAISALKGAGAFYGVDYAKLFTTIKQFTALINVLAAKFPDMTRQELAEKFKTPVAEHYINLGDNLCFATTLAAEVESDADFMRDMIQAIDEGADVNYSSPFVGSPLGIAQGKSKITEILLQAGANSDLIKMPDHKVLNDPEFLKTLNELMEEFQ